MNKFAKISALLFMAVVSLTACGNNETVSNEESSESRIYQKAETEETSTQTPEVETLDDFEKIIQDYENDKNYDPTTMKYEVYVEKVMVNDNSASTEIIVGSKAKVSETKTIEKAIAAEKPYLDSFSVSGPEMEAKTQWNVTDELGYSADSIVTAALKYANIDEDDLDLYERHILKSTY